MSQTKPVFRTVAYLRISTGDQDLDAQKLEIHEHARKNGLKIDEFVEAEVSRPGSRTNSARSAFYWKN